MHDVRRGVLCGAVVASITLAATARAVVVPLQVTVENLAPANSISFAPIRFGVGNGSFDTFNAGQAAFLLGQPTIATAPIVTVAEGGSGSTWFPAFSSAEPNANTGSVAGPGGPFTPGASNSTIISVDTANRFFTFASMVVPSNDFFVGNDSPTAFELFDANGDLVLNSIVQEARDIWDAGSETENPNNAAFLVIGNNDLRENENGVVHLNFAELSTFDGLVTAAGYTFDADLLSADTDILRITLAVVPEPASLAMVGAMGAMMLRRRSRT
jgi:hypothetical protein